jgi:hypothetical protein
MVGWGILMTESYPVKVKRDRLRGLIHLYGPSDDEISPSYHPNILLCEFVNPYKRSPIVLAH